MKWIIAIIRPNRLDAVRDALAQVGVAGMTVSEVRGYGRQKGHVEIYRGTEYDITYVPKLRLEVAVDDGIADKVIDTIRDAANTGKIGDGKLFVLNLEDALRIRTGESGTDAL